MASPVVAVPASPGDVHVWDPWGSTSIEGFDAPLTPALVSAVLTALLISVLPFPGRTPTRAPARAAWLSKSKAMMLRPISMDPKTNNMRTGATTANSTAAAPLLPEAWTHGLAG